MKRLMAVLLPLILFSGHSSSANNVNVNKACEKADVDDYNFCVTSLQAVRATATADMAGLAVVTARLSITNITRAESRINELLKRMNITNNDPTKTAMEDCIDQYKDATESLNQAMEYVKEKAYDYAFEMQSEAVYSTKVCRDGFELYGLQFPIDKEDNNISRLLGLFGDFVEKMQQQQQPLF